jgi:hypothetical protein
MGSIRSGKLALLILFLSACAVSQEPAVIRVGIPTVASNIEKVPSADAQTQLLQLLNAIKPDKKHTASIQAIALKASNRSEAFAEARKSACQFVLFAKIQEAVPKILRFREPPKVIRVGYEIARVDSGADYALGSAEAPLSGSPQSAAEKAEKRVVQNVTMELCGKGSAPLAVPATPAPTTSAANSDNSAVSEKSKPISDQATSQPGEQAQALAELAGIDPAQMNAAVPPSPSPPQSASNAAPDLCSSMAGEILHAQSLAGACEFALAIPRRMPNFICEETTGRFREDSHHATDVITASLRYEDGKESFSDVKLNGTTVPYAAFDQLSGLWSTGEFGGNLRGIFDPTNKPAFAFIGDKKLGKRPTWAFSYRIAEQTDPVWWLTADDQRIAPPYSGELWLDQKTGELVLFRLTADGIPAHFPTQTAETLTAYNNVSFDDGTGFVLPLQSVVKTKYHGVLTTNVLRFRNCHKFRAKSKMLLDVPEPKHP